jgi:low affinity Fe/Cu permease
VTDPATPDIAPEGGSFLRACRAVSAAMSRPTNITVWAIAIIVWTCLFAFGGRHLASGSWLPAWFTSQGFNFPLNLITTVAELFIGFLVGTATAAAQASLSVLLEHMRDALNQHELTLTRLEGLESKMELQIEENTQLTREIHAATAAGPS